MSPASGKEREISIAWFADLTGALGKYLAVLRYELEQSGDIETVEALIHAEMVKILIRQFTPGCIDTEYGIGKLFSKAPNKAGQLADRRFRADIAIYHPVEDRRLTSSRPFAVIELKREGDAAKALDDIYRLAIVSLKIGATGYFVFAGPKALVDRTIESVPVLKKMQAGAEDRHRPDGPHRFAFTTLKKSSLYNDADHPGTGYFFGQRMFGEENASTSDPYQIRVFAFHVRRAAIADREGQRVSLMLRSLVEQDDDSGELPPI